ncbi:MAG: hypothetical protein COB16_09390 [Rhodobacteraceae bacterium]|nr:MAG: hypothetical protein COB16_09390 [Paracoccaceae bacterium]
MTPHSRVAALTALVLAVAAHAAPAFFQDSSKAEIAGGNTELAAQGNSFANMVAGMPSTEVPQEITEAEDVTEQAEEPPVDELVEQAVEQQIKDVVKPQAEPPQDIVTQEVAKPAEQPAKVEPLEMAAKGAQLQDLLTTASAPLLQETPPVETLKPQQTVTHQTHQQPQKTAEKPAEQVQVAPKPETLAPVPKPKPKPKPKPRGNSAQNAVQGTLEGQNSKPGGQADTHPGKAQVQGNAAASNYGGLIVRRINRSKRTISIKGVAKVSFSIRPDGSLAGLRISRSSGSGKLDRFFLKTVQRAAPFPPPPSGAQTNFGVELHGRK